MIEIEFEKPHFFKCECCGGQICRLTRFVYFNENTHAVYYIQFNQSHEEDYVLGIISIGEWGDGSDIRNRKGFPFRIWTKEGNYQVGLMDKSESPWNDGEDVLGEILDRKAALKHDWIQEVFHITDHIVAEDKEVIEFLK